MKKTIKKIIQRNQNRCTDESNINYEKLKEKMKNNAILLDVRSVQEYNEGHLPNAIHLAYYDIPSKHNLILSNKLQEIVVYCQNGGRSKKAYKKLKKLGYKNVYNLCGGLESII